MKAEFNQRILFKSSSSKENTLLKINSQYPELDSKRLLFRKSLAKATMNQNFLLERVLKAQSRNCYVNYSSRKSNKDFSLRSTDSHRTNHHFSSRDINRSQLSLRPVSLFNERSNENNKEKESSRLIINLGFSHIKSIKTIFYSGINGDKTPKMNQDCLLILKEVYGYKDFNIVGLCNEQSKDGYLISNLFKKHFKNYIRNIPDLMNKTSHEIYHSLINKRYEIITNAISSIQKKIMSQYYTYDPLKNTMTCSLIFQLGNKIICASIGLINYAFLVNNIREIIPLSNKQNYLSVKDSPTKKNKRTALEFFNSPKNREAIYTSRSIGDSVFKKYGVIPQAEINEITLNNEHQFIVIASEGLLKYVPEQTIVTIGHKMYNNFKSNHDFCREIIDKAYSTWENPMIKNNERDDMSLISLFL